MPELQIVRREALRRGAELGWALPALLAGAAFALGCGTIDYSPRTPARAHGDDVDVQLTAIEAPGGEVRYRTSLSAPPQTDLRRARLRPRAPIVSVPSWPDSNCSAKPDARWAELDGRRLAPPLAIGGRHRVDFGFPLWDQYCVPETLELEIVRNREMSTVRLPTGIPDRWQITNPFAMFAALETGFATADVTGVRAIAAMTTGFGLWQAPVRLIIEPVGFGIAICDESTCPPDGEGRSVGITLPLGASVTWYPWVDDPYTYNPRGPFAIGLELRFREYLAWLPEYGGTELRLLHAPQAVFHLVTTSARAPHGLVAGPRLSSFDLEVSGGALIASDDGATEAAFLAGASFSLYWWL